MQFTFRHSGFSLIEVLIALAIMSVVLLGLVSLQNAALSQTYSVYFQSVAVSQAGSLLERFRASRTVAAREREFNDWLQEVQQFLPQGTGDYQCSSNDIPCVVHVYWQAHGLQTFSLSTLI